MSAEPGDVLATLRSAAPAARRAAAAHCRGALLWGWLAWRLYWRLATYRVIEGFAAALGQALFVTLVAGGTVVLAVRGFAGLIGDAWRALRS